MIFSESALVLRAQTDERAREELITRQEKNILRVASRAKHRFVTKSDDEWAVALCAFSHAIDTYLPEKGTFFSYSETLIRRSLIDAHRTDAKYAMEIAVSPDLFDGNTEEGEPNPVVSVTVQASMHAADTTLKDEILAANEELERFGFRFFDLTSCSPSRESSRRDCLFAAKAVAAGRESYDQLLRTGQLPVKYLISKYSISAKLLERYRKYIIAVVVICAGDYPALQEYILGGRGKKT